MCLGIPGKVIEIRDEAGLKMGRVDFGGVRKEACLSYVPEVVPGDYVIVHVGFAISRVDEEEALKTLELLSMMGDLVDQELATMGPGMGSPAVVDDPGGRPGGSTSAPAATTLPSASPFSASSASAAWASAAPASAIVARPESVP